MEPAITADIVVRINTDVTETADATREYSGLAAGKSNEFIKKRDLFV